MKFARENKGACNDKGLKLEPGQKSKRAMDNKKMIVAAWQFVEQFVQVLAEVAQ